MHEAHHYSTLEDGVLRCDLCPHRCVVKDGRDGLCGTRGNSGGKMVLNNYGRVSALHIDPIEKKPLYHFHPGARILSLGNNGCNLRCRFCQNWQISQSTVPTHEVTPDSLLRMVREHGLNLVAFTYAEPTIWYEYIMDCARLLHAHGIKVVLVTNGYINPEPFEELQPFIDAMNVDIKSMDDVFYKQLCRAGLEPVLETCRRAAGKTHLEITNLVITGENDREEMFHDLGRFISGELGPTVPLHLSRYYPSYQMDNPPTPIATLEKALSIVRQYLKFVYLGNVPAAATAHTICPECGHVLVQRQSYSVGHVDVGEAGACPGCGFDSGIIR